MRKRAVNKREARINAFYKFLLAENAFVEYRENVRKDISKTLTTIFNERIASWISLAFEWDKSESGYNYWLDMCGKWDKYRKVNKIT